MKTGPESWSYPGLSGQDDLDRIIPGSLLCVAAAEEAPAALVRVQGEPNLGVFRSVEIVHTLQVITALFQPSFAHELSVDADLPLARAPLAQLVQRVLAQLVAGNGHRFLH